MNLLRLKIDDIINGIKAKYGYRWEDLINVMSRVIERVDSGCEY